LNPFDYANLSHALAEFYYEHAFDQNRGVGLTAAHEFLDKHPAGRWLKSQLPAAQPARSAEQNQPERTLP
jgi:hypothetical protein